jgi:hypothetical protein
MYVYTHTHNGLQARQATGWFERRKAKINLNIHKYMYVYIHTHNGLQARQATEWFERRKAKINLNIHEYMYVYTHTHNGLQARQATEWFERRKANKRRLGDLFADCFEFWLMVRINSMVFCVAMGFIEIWMCACMCVMSPGAVRRPLCGLLGILRDGENYCMALRRACIHRRSCMSICMPAWDC